MFAGPIVAPRVAPLVLTFQNISAESTGSSITLPTGSGLVKGDFAMLYQSSANNSGIPTAQNPAGWTQFINQGGLVLRAMVSGKVITDADIAAGTVAGMDGDKGDSKYILWWRPNRLIQSIAGFSVNQPSPSGGDPTSQTINPTGQTGPVIMYGHAIGSGAISVSGTLNSGGTAHVDVSTGKIVTLIQTSLSSLTWDMGDSGSLNCLGSTGVAFE